MDTNEKFKNLLKRKDDVFNRLSKIDMSGVKEREREKAKQYKNTVENLSNSVDHLKGILDQLEFAVPEKEDLQKRKKNPKELLQCIDKSMPNEFKNMNLKELNTRLNNAIDDLNVEKDA